MTLEERDVGEKKMKEKTSEEINRFGKIIQKSWVVCLLASFCCLLWGSAFPFIKIGYQLFQIEAKDFATQILFAGFRFTIAGVITVLLGCIIQRKILIPRREACGKILVISLFQTVLQYLFFYIGLANTTGVKASIINGTSVFFAILISSYVFRQEKLTLRAGVGCIIGFVGVVIANSSKGSFTLDLKFLGEGFILLSALSSGFSSAVMKKFSKNENPVVLSGYQFFVGGLLMVLCGTIFGGSITVVTVKGMVLLVYLASLSAVAYSIWGILLKYNSVSKVTVFGFANPVFGAILSMIFLKESASSFGMQGMIALVFVCTGIYIVNAKKES